MKKSSVFLAVLVLAASTVFPSCCNCDGPDAVTFDISRGVNIGNWLSQSDVRGEERDRAFNENFARNLASYGFDHIRLPVDEVQLFDENGNFDETTLNLVKRTIDQCGTAGLKVLFDLHIVRSHDFDSRNNPLWTSVEEQDRLLALWKKIDEELGGYSPDLVAYEFLNEPVAPDPEQWNALFGRFIRQIREHDAERVLVIESNRWGGSKHVPEMDVPENDPNIIVEMHFYEPYLLTHYRADWSKFADLSLSSPMEYPGRLIPSALYDSLSEEEKELVDPYNMEYDKAVLLGFWQKAIDFAASRNLRLYLGEFGCLPGCGRENRLNWLSDVVSLCRENGISYCYWEYNRIFGFADGNGNVTDRDILDILTK